MRKLTVAALVLIQTAEIVSAQTSQLEAPAKLSSPIGDWSRGDGKAKVRVDRCGPSLCAVNTWIAAGVDGEHVGDRLIMNVKLDGPSIYSGTAQDPQRNMNYDLKIELTERSMTTRGCILWVLCKDMGWTRIGQNEN